MAHIHEAVTAALATGKCIARKAWESPYNPRITPTTTPDGCVLFSGAMKIPCRGWQPTAVDLIADDWIVLSQNGRSKF